MATHDRWLLLALFAVAGPLDGQTPRDSVVVKAAKADLDSIARDRSAPQYSKRAQTRIRARLDSLLVAPTPAPLPVPVPPDSARYDGPAEIPRAVPDTTPVPGTIYGVQTTLQAALDAAPCGSHITLTNGQTYTEAVVWRRQCALSVTLRAATLPPAGRFRPSVSGANAPKLVSPGNNAPALTMAKGSSGLRVDGVEITAAVSVRVLVACGQPPEASAADFPDRLVLHRVWVHGRAGQDIVRGVEANCRNLAVYDSWIDGIVSAFDAAAVWGYTGPGPILLANNYLEASGETVMFGGANDPYVAGVSPCDITITRNHISKPAVLSGLTKNLIEFKNACRVLVEANEFSGLTAVNQQEGFFAQLTGTDQECRAKWAGVSDVTFRWNRVSNVLAGFNLMGWRKTCPDGPRAHRTMRVSVHDNLFTKFTGTAERGMVMQADADTVTFARNTYEYAGYWLVFDGSAKDDGGVQALRLENNLASTYTFIHVPDGLAALGTYAPGLVNTGNVVAAPSTPLPSSPGVDRAELARRVAGVVVPP